MRSDGLSAVLRPLLDDVRIVAATLVDVASGLTLDGYADDPALADLELLGASQADLVRAADGLGGAGGGSGELTLSTDDGLHHLVHAVPDPHGDRLVVAVVVRGSARHVTRARKRLRQVSVAALTAGPSTARRPVDGTWVLDPTPPVPTGVTAPAEPPVPSGNPAPLSAMAPGDAGLSDGPPATARSDPPGR